MRSDIEQTGKGGNREAAVISAAEIARMRQSAKVISDNDAAQQKKIAEEQKAQQQAAAKARKQRMMQMDKDRSKKLPPTDIEKEQNARAEGLLAKAQ